MEKKLFFDRRFWPMFWTQFLGAFNDNVFKNALVILITFKSYKLLGLGTEQMVALCGGVFILPFFLFSAVAGQICDKYNKDQLVRYIKVWEIVVMLLGSLGFFLENVPLLLITLFLMGLQSTFFGPIKYSILPEIIKKDELVEANALVEMGTFLAILLGTILGGVLISIEQSGKIFVSLAVLLFALKGYLFSRGINQLQPINSGLNIRFGILRPTWEVVQIIKQTKGLFLSVLGISWFWFLGASLLSIFPVYVKNVFNGNEHVVTLFLAIFSIGVAIGSMLCEKFSDKKLELGLVPIGTIGMSVFIIDLFFIKALNGPEVGIIEFFSTFNGIRATIDLLGLSIFSGFYIVPLYTFIQMFSKQEVRSRVIAANNVLNAFFMVFSAIFLGILYALNLSFGQIFLILGFLNLIVSLYIYTVIPEFMLRFISFLLTKVMYRFKVHGSENIPSKGGAILICNHVSFVDWLIIAAGIRRPPRYVMWYKFMQVPLVGFLFKDARVIPIAQKKEDPKILEDGMNEIKKGLLAGDLLCIFPEGEITKDGKLGEFRTGIEKILNEVSVPVIPMTLNGLWGSFFSRVNNGKALSCWKTFFTRWFARVELNIYPAWSSKEVSAKKLEDYTNEKLNSNPLNQ